MSSSVLSFLEIGMILDTSLVIGILIYEIKKNRRIYAVIGGGLLIWGYINCIIMSGLEKQRLQGTPVIWGLFIFHVISVLILFVMAATKKMTRPGKDAIIEAFDKMDIGVCYYDSTGRIVLCNEYMHDIALRIWGTRVVNGPELLKRLQSIWTPNDGENTYEFQGAGCQFAVCADSLKMKNETMTEVIITDVSGLKARKKEMESNNGRLEELNLRLSEYGEIADKVIREQEILNAKIMVHDRFGNLLLTTKRAIEEKVSDEELSRILGHIKSTLSFMDKEEREKQEGCFEELSEAADSIGVKIHISGDIPKGENQRDILLLGIRECLTNTVKHANGHNLYVTIAKEEKLRIQISNDGERPKGKVMPGTGLSALKSKVEKNGGKMSIETEDGFVLKMIL